MPPVVFGPILWRQLHTRPDETGGDLSNEPYWLGAFQAAVSCPQCAFEFWDLRMKHPEDLTNTQTYKIWAYRIHNAINLRLGKPLFPWPPDWGEFLQIKW